MNDIRTKAEKEKYPFYVDYGRISGYQVYDSRTKLPASACIDDSDNVCILCTNLNNAYARKLKETV